MNYLNPIFKINKYVFITTLILYLTVYFGMLFQMVLGVTQLATAIYVTYSFYKALQKENRKWLVIYWVTVVVDLAVAFFMGQIWQPSAAIFVFLFPMIIAGLFLKLLSNIRHEINEQ